MQWSAQSGSASASAMTMSAPPQTLTATTSALQSANDVHDCAWEYAGIQTRLIIYNTFVFVDVRAICVTRKALFVRIGAV